MSSSCDGCDGVGCEHCEHKNERRTYEPENAGSHVKNVIAVMSGKGGVGKSLTTAMLACATARLGYKVAVMDADITGPSIPKLFGMSDMATSDGTNIFPVVSKGGIKVLSINLMLEDPTQPVVWRGPILGNVVKQFWTDTVWDEVDYMFIDMPPGTGDVPLTVFQSLPVDGIVMVTTPQDLVSMIVNKAVTMANMMNVPILGIVENMSYIACPDCGKKIELFGASNIDKVAGEHSLPVLARMPIVPAIATACDAGEIESVELDEMREVASYITSLE